MKVNNDTSCCKSLVRLLSITQRDHLLLFQVAFEVLALENTSNSSAHNACVLRVGWSHDEIDISVSFYFKCGLLSSSK